MSQIKLPVVKARIVDIKDNIFSVRPITHQNELWGCKHSLEFFPIVDGDYVQLEDYTLLGTGVQGFNVLIELKKYPYVSVAYDEFAIKNCVDYRQKMNPKAQEKYSTLFGTDGQALNNIAEEYKVNRDPLIFNAYSEINPAELAKFLSSWYRKVLERQLFLWGFNRKEINSCYMSITQIVNQCTINPFCLSGLTLDKAAMVAERLGKKITEKQYQAARIYHQLLADCREHNTSSKVEDILAKFPKADEVFEELLGPDYNVVYEHDSLYTPFMYKMETKVIEEIKKRNVLVKGMPFERKFNIITGGPGTGKTHEIADINKKLKGIERKARAAAFTGLAVDRIQEVDVNINGATIHLMMARRQMYSGFTDIIFDEASMISTELLWQFFMKFSGDDFTITVVGDPDQLPPISGGRLLRELLKVKCLNIKRLTINHRLSDKTQSNALYRNLEKIREGKTDFASDDSFMIQGGGMADVIELAKTFIEAKSNFYILSPKNEDVKNINKQIQHYRASITRAKSTVDISTNFWYEGDNVMMLENNYEHNIFNGSKGKIVKIEKNSIFVAFKNQKLVEFKTNVKSRTREERNENKEDKKQRGKFERSTGAEQDENALGTNILALTDALTIHKSQGSECDVAVLYLPKDNLNFVTRPWIYTACSRAKDMCIVIDEGGQFDSCVLRECESAHDNLAKRLNE